MGATYGLIVSGAAGRIDWAGSGANILLGVVASLVVWLALTKYLAPSFYFESHVVEGQYPSGERSYRLLYQNKRWWAAEDIEPQVKLRVPYFHRTGFDFPRVTSFVINLGADPRIASLPHRSKLTRRRFDQALSFGLIDLPLDSMRRYISDDHLPITDLRQFMEATGATLRLTLRAAHRFSGA